MQIANNVDLQTYSTFSTYLISTVPFQGVQLRSRNDLSQNISPITIEEELEPNPNPRIEDNAPNEDNTYVLTELPQKEQLKVNRAPPYPERLALEKLVVPPEYSIETELKNLCVKIPLLQAIRDIRIYAKIIRELCLKKVGRKKKYPPTIQFIGQSVDQLTNQMQIDNYEDSGNPIVTICIKGTYIPNTFIDLGEAINMMTLQTMRELNILNL